MTLGNVNSSGYMTFQINRKSQQVHRLAWLHEYGYLPEHHIDHIDGNKLNNRISNLRHVTRSCNLQNQKERSDNKSGFPGVSFRKKDKKYIASIQINKKWMYIGCFESAIEAALARLTTESNHPNWKCNSRSELVSKIRAAGVNVINDQEVNVQ